MQLLRGQIGERALRSTSSFFAVVSSAGNTTVLKSLGLAGATNAYATSTTSSSAAVFKPKLYLEIVMALLDSVNRLLEDESRVLVAAEVAKLATLLVMALVAYKQLREFLDTVGKLGASNMSSGPLENELDAETVSSIETAVKELLRKTSACKSNASPTNGLLLELSLLEYGAKSLNPSNMKKELGKAAGKVVVGIFKTAMKGGFPDASIWTGLRDAAVALREGADQAVAQAVFLTALRARSSALELTGEVGRLTRAAKNKAADGAASSIVELRRKLGQTYQMAVVRSKNARQVVMLWVEECDSLWNNH